MTKYLLLIIYTIHGDNMKKFKIRKGFNIIFIWYILIMFVFYEIISYSIVYIKIDNTIVTTLLNDTNPHIVGSNIFHKAFNYFVDIDSLNKVNNNLYQDSNFMFSKDTNPKVYIYNTHNEEEYMDGYVKGYSLSPGVVMASYILKDNLTKLGIPTIVETNKVSEQLSKEGLDFYKSYTISRRYVEDKLSNYPNLNLIIDLHRDSVDRKYTYTTINGISYAKVLFVVGEKYDSYKDNLNLSNKISNKIKDKYPDLTRGIMMKDKDNQNGIYNQDLNKNMVLMELGSNNNTIEEVNNTIEVIAPILKEVIDEESN